MGWVSPNLFAAVLCLLVQAVPNKVKIMSVKDDVDD